MTLALGRLFICQLGCNIKTTRIVDLYEHFFASHSHLELAKWGINKDVLEMG